LRQAINSPIQGGASDVTLDALVRCWKYFRDNNLAARVVLNVHDQLLFEVREDLKESLKELLPRLMYYKFPDSPVEFLVDINECYRWEKA
jgi:DNA polymerase-1